MAFKSYGWQKLALKPARVTVIRTKRAVKELQRKKLISQDLFVLLRLSCFIGHLLCFKDCHLVHDFYCLI